MVALDIVIPVYNEGDNIIATLESLRDHVRTPYRILVCYDTDEDTTLAALDGYDSPGVEIVRVKNPGRGAFRAIVTGFARSEAPAVLVFPADDDYNAPRLDAMVERMRQGNDIVCASRFIAGGCMIGCPWLKAVLVRSSAFALRHLARVPCHDSSNGFRLFSRHVLKTIPLESNTGFVYSIELLVKAHRLGLPIAEVPVHWYERKAGKSRFRVLMWSRAYLRWFFYAFATTYLGRGPETVATFAESEGSW